jgi:tetratricopeptide (TPR) repeat protein
MIDAVIILLRLLDMVKSIMLVCVILSLVPSNALAASRKTQSALANNWQAQTGFPPHYINGLPPDVFLERQRQADAIRQQQNAENESIRLKRLLAEYNSLISRNPKDAISYNNRGHLKFESFQDNQGAFNDFSKAISLNPKFVSARVGRGVTRISMGDKSTGMKELCLAKRIAETSGDKEDIEDAQGQLSWQLFKGAGEDLANNRLRSVIIKRINETCGH